jgi:Mg2+-importing ATPase
MDVSTLFWSLPLEQLLAELESDPEQGLSPAEAAARLACEGPNQLSKASQADLLLLLLRQFSSPLVVILIVAALLSFSLSDATDGGIILAIVLVSGLLGFAQERGAAKAMGALLQADEPTAALDRETDREAVQLFRRLADEQHAAIVMVTHDNKILDVADRIVNLEEGRLV